MSEKFNKLDDNDKKVISLLSWAYREGFKAASKTLVETEKAINIEELQDQFIKTIIDGKNNTK